MIDLGHPLVARAALTCRACPVQVEGSLTDGRHFYFRYRSGRATLGIGRDQDAAVSDPWEVDMRYGDDLQGGLSDAETAEVFRALLKRRLPPDPDTKEDP